MPLPGKVHRERTSVLQGSAVCDSAGDNHDTERVASALQFPRAFRSLPRFCAQRLQVSPLYEATGTQAGDVREVTSGIHS